jgi:hypothetical protein
MQTITQQKSHTMGFEGSQTASGQNIQPFGSSLGSWSVQPEPGFYSIITGPANTQSLLERPISPAITSVRFTGQANNVGVEQNLWNQPDYTLTPLSQTGWNAENLDVHAMQNRSESIGFQEGPFGDANQQV